MKFCADHWDRLRQAIADRGLDGLVKRSSQESIEDVKADLENRQTAENFDPLMGAHNLILTNTLSTLDRLGFDPLVMFAADVPAHAECPICYLNWLSAEHDRTCSEPNCGKQRGQTFDWMIDRAADDVRDRWREMAAQAGEPREP